MKKKIFISILVLFTFVFCNGFIFNFNNDKEEEQQYIVESIKCFKDDNIDNYTLMELEILLLEQKNIQANAHDLAEYARSLGWPETSLTIINAQTEWGNAQLAIDYYQKIYDNKLKKIYEEQWEKRKNEYPEATKVWLYMKNLGWNDYVCAGIMGNLMTETGGQTLNIKPNSKNNTYYGICQWNKNHKKVWNKDLNKQIEYLHTTIKSEIDTFGYAYKKDFNFNDFLNLQDEKTVALVFAKTYERCGSESYSIRQENATKAYNYFAK